MAEKEWDPKKSWVMVPVKQLLAWGNFAPYENTMLQLSIHMTSREMLSKWYRNDPIPIFVSHRWDTPDTPDPSGKQFHIVMRFLTEAICLSKGICERFFSYAEPEIVLSSTLRECIQNHHADRLEALRELENYKKYQDLPAQMLPMEVLLSRWLSNNFPNLHFESDELATIASILRDVVVWYDYSSLPQRPYASEKEEAYFAWALKHLEHLIPDCHVAAIWDKPAINRAWCLLEGLIAEAVQNGNYDASPNTTFGGAWSIPQFDFNTKYKDQHPNRQMAHHVRDLRETFKGMEPERIIEYFHANQIVCTKSEDLAVVAETLYRFLSSPR